MRIQIVVAALVVAGCRSSDDVSDLIDPFRAKIRAETEMERQTEARSDDDLRKADAATTTLPAVAQMFVTAGSSGMPLDACNEMLREPASNAGLRWERAQIEKTIGTCAKQPYFAIVVSDSSSGYVDFGDDHGAQMHLARAGFVEVWDVAANRSLGVRHFAVTEPVPTSIEASYAVNSGRLISAAIAALGK